MLALSRTSFTALLMSIALLFALPASAQTLKKASLKSGAERTSGTVSLVKSGSRHQIKFAGNFRTKPGPGLVLYLGNGKPSKRIGKMRAAGAQTFNISAADAGRYSTVYVYCEPFKKVFGSARIK